MKLFAGVLVLLLAASAVMAANTDADTESHAEAQAQTQVQAQTEAAAEIQAETQAEAEAEAEAKAGAEAHADTETAATASSAVEKPKKNGKGKDKSDGKKFKPVMIDRDTRRAVYHHHHGVRYADGGAPQQIYFPAARQFIRRILAGVRRAPRRFQLGYRMGGWPIRVFGVRRFARRPPRKQYFEPIYEDEHNAIEHIKRHIEEARRPRQWRPFMVIGRNSPSHGYGLPIRGWIRRRPSVPAVLNLLRRLRPRRASSGWALPQFPAMPLSARRHIARSNAVNAMQTLRQRMIRAPLRQRLQALQQWLRNLPSVRVLPGGGLAIRRPVFARGIRGSLSALDWAMSRMEALSKRLTAAREKLRNSNAKGEKLRRNKQLLSKIQSGMTSLAAQIARVEGKMRSAGVRVPVEPLATGKAKAKAGQSYDDKDDDADDDDFWSESEDVWRSYGDTGEDDDD